MAGSGKRKTAEDIKNIDMMTVRNKTQQEVTDVIFPNGLTVGLADPRFNNGMKIHGNVESVGVINASGPNADLRINGVTVVASGPDGDDGTDGTNGTNGTNGLTVTGPTGPPGGDGDDGTNGTNGLSITGPTGPAGSSASGINFVSTTVSVSTTRSTPAAAQGSMNGANIYRGIFGKNGITDPAHLFDGYLCTSQHDGLHIAATLGSGDSWDGHAPATGTMASIDDAVGAIFFRAPTNCEINTVSGFFEGYGTGAHASDSISIQLYKTAAAGNNIDANFHLITTCLINGSTAFSVGDASWTTAAIQRVAASVLTHPSTAAGTRVLAQGEGLAVVVQYLNKTAVTARALNATIPLTVQYTT